MSMTVTTCNLLLAADQTCYHFTAEISNFEHSDVKKF